MEPGQLIADRYRLERVLGEGGMGTVFAAANALTGKPVAIKCLHADLTENEEYTARFLREAQVAGRIDHPNVVNIFDVGRHKNHIFLVMELLQGETLAARIERGPQEPSQFIQVMLPALRGVHAAHRIGVTHRDLKPDNIFLPCGPDGELREAKVLDFGISKISEEMVSAGRKQLTREGAIFGTPQYMAPEQIRDARNTDARSDVYALGVIFYRALSGEFPFSAETLPGLALRIVEGDTVHLAELCPELDPELAAVIMRALSVDPEQRFPTVAALGEALEPFSGGYTFATNAGASWVDLGAGEAAGELHARTPGSRRAAGQRTPASQPRVSVARSEPGREDSSGREGSAPGRTGHDADLSQRVSAAPTPAGQHWTHARRPALGLVALLLVLGGGALWLITTQLPGARTAQPEAPDERGATPERAVARPVAPAPTTATPTTAAAAAPEPVNPLTPASVAEEPARAEQPAQDARQDLAPPTQEDSEPRPRRQRRPARDSASEPRAPGKGPTGPVPAVEAPRPAPEPVQQATPALEGSESNPYLRR